MFDYHLWIELSETTEESDCGNLDKKVAQLREVVEANLSCCFPEDCIRGLNYMMLFQCSGSRNHRGSELDAILKVLEFICRELPGSHGLVYWSDDENPGNAVFDSYRVMVIARGKVEHRLAPFLSPKNPVVED